MTTIGMHYDVLPGKEATFVEGFRKVLQALQSVPGHEESRLFEDAFQKGSFLILSKWADRTSFDAFIQSKAFRAVADWGKSELLRTRPTHEIF